YFLLNGMQDRFRYLNYGLGAILAFVGVKMILTFTGEELAFPTEDFHIATPISLGVIVVVLTITIVTSLMADKQHGGPPAPTSADAGDDDDVLDDRADEPEAVSPGSESSTD
ncbi:MAG: hypothetical protein ACR2JF_02825, partial [Iamia sp.]